MIKPEIWTAVTAEHIRCLTKYPAPQNYPNGTGSDELVFLAKQVIEMLVQTSKSQNTATWAQILLGECCEALAEHDPAYLKGELIQVANVAMSWASNL